MDELQPEAAALYAQDGRPEWFDLPSTPGLGRVPFGGGRALDLGAGGGRNAACLLNLGWRVDCFELYPHAVAAGRVRAPTAQWHQRSVLELADVLERGSIDLAIDVLGPACDLKEDLLPRYIDRVHQTLGSDGRWLIVCFLRADELAPWLDQFECLEDRDISEGRLIELRPLS